MRSSSGALAGSMGAAMDNKGVTANVAAKAKRNKDMDSPTDKRQTMMQEYRTAQASWQPWIDLRVAVALDGQGHDFAVTVAVKFNPVDFTRHKKTGG